MFIQNLYTTGIVNLLKTAQKKKITPGNNADVLKQVSGQTKQKGDTAYHAILLSNEKGNELLIHTQCR